VFWGCERKEKVEIMGCWEELALPYMPVDVVCSKTFACDLLATLLSTVLLLLVVCSEWAYYHVKQCTKLSLQQYIIIQ
jgi:hypothetical protein